MAPHQFRCRVSWTGNLGTGTSGYSAFGRDHLIEVAGKPPIAGSSVPEFLGDAARYNPEDLLVAALSSCHMLWYLHLCSDAGVIVLSYSDDAHGIMRLNPDGSGEFTSVALHPDISVAPGTDMSVATSLHAAAHAKCFIARSVNFPVTCKPTIRET